MILGHASGFFGIFRDFSGFFSSSLEFVWQLFISLFFLKKKGLRDT